MTTNEINNLPFHEQMEYLETGKVIAKIADYTIKGDIIEVKSEVYGRVFIEPISGKEVYIFGQQFDLIKKDLPNLTFNFKEENNCLIPFESWKIINVKVKGKNYDNYYLKAVLK